MEKLKILVVDDEARMRKLVKDFLIKSKFDGKPMGRMIGKWVFEEELLLNYWKSSYLEWQQAPESDFVNMPVNNTNKDTLEFIAGEVDEMKTILTV